MNERKDISNDIDNFACSGGDCLLHKKRSEKNNILAGSSNINGGSYILGNKKNDN